MPELAARLLAASYFFMEVNVRKFILSVLLFFIVFNFCDASQVYAISEPNKIDIYLDGFPCTGEVIGGSSDVNVYDIPSSGSPVVVDTLPVGSSLTIKSLNVLNNASNYYFVSYTAEDTVKTGYILFDFVEPVGAVITPAPGSDLEYNELRLAEFFTAIRDFIYGVINFFASLHNYLLVLFPFLTDTQVNFFITFASLFLSLSIYLLFRKVLI